MIPAAFLPFIEKTPLCVMVRLTLERLFSPALLDALFLKNVQRQYQRELLFSQIVELMMAVVLRVDDSVRSAYLKRAAALNVSHQAVYDKLQHVELGVSAALVADSAAQCGAVIDELKTRLPPLLPGRRVRILDGNHLSATEKRLEVLRSTWAAALPGKVLAVFEPELDLVTNVFLSPDGHAQERSMLDDVLKIVQAKDLWIADRNFCTLGFLSGVAAKQAAFVVRQHGQMAGRLVGERRACGTIETGQVYEQMMELHHDGQEIQVRRITVELDKPTRDGDKEIHVLTNLPAAEADAATVAKLYAERWTIEGRFYEVTQTLECEPNTLAYPKAALFAFCLALVASNAFALIRASLRTAQEAEVIKGMSRHFMALEVKQTYLGMMVALPPEMWLDFRTLSIAEWAEILRKVASHVNPKQYPKTKRGPKKPPPKKSQYVNGGHVSTHKLLEEKRAKRGTP